LTAALIRCVPASSLAPSKAELDEWFCELHPGRSVAGAKATGHSAASSSAASESADIAALDDTSVTPQHAHVHFPAIDGVCLPGLAVPMRHARPETSMMTTSVGFPSGPIVHAVVAEEELPPILILDASLLDAHFNVLLAVEVVPAPASAAVQSGAEKAKEVARDTLPPLMPGCYVVVIESLPAKCKSLWKYAGPAAVAFAALHGVPMEHTRAAALSAEQPRRPLPAIHAAPSPSVAAGQSGGSSPRVMVETCPQCRGPVWRAASGGPGLHLHVSQKPFRELEDWEVAAGSGIHNGQVAESTRQLHLL
jgi:hypothetical protein